MFTIQTKATLSKEGMLTVQIPLSRSLPPGELSVVLVISEEPAQANRLPPHEFSVYPVGLISDDFTFRREDLYGDNGG